MHFSRTPTVRPEHAVIDQSRHAVVQQREGVGRDNRRIKYMTTDQSVGKAGKDGQRHLVFFKERRDKPFAGYIQRNERNGPCQNIAEGRGPFMEV